MKQIIAPQIKITYVPNTPIKERPILGGPIPAFEILKGYWDPGLIQIRCECKLLALTTTKQLLGIFDLSAGSAEGSVSNSGKRARRKEPGSGS